jgi:hypothetical protein
VKLTLAEQSSFASSSGGSVLMNVHSTIAYRYSNRLGSLVFGSANTGECRETNLDVCDGRRVRRVHQYRDESNFGYVDASFSEVCYFLAAQSLVLCFELLERFCKRSRARPTKKIRKTLRTATSPYARVGTV